MENGQIPPMQPGMSGQFGAPNPMMNGQPLAPDGRPMVQQINVMPKQKDTSGMVKTIVIIALALLAVTFLGLFIWMTMQYNTERGRDLDGEIEMAVAAAKAEQAAKDEDEFLKREKEPYRTFSGPADYGALTFSYPKTWSVYVEEAANTGGDFKAYFNPIQVDAVGKDTINALRVTIMDKSFEDVAATYQKEIEGKEPTLSVQSITVNGAAANRYTGKIPGTDLSGFIVIFKIRDKTVIMQTDSTLFEEDFNKLIETVTFNA